MKCTYGVTITNVKFLTKFPMCSADDLQQTTKLIGNVKVTSVTDPLRSISGHLSFKNVFIVLFVIHLCPESCALDRWERWPTSRRITTRARSPTSPCSTSTTRRKEGPRGTASCPERSTFRSGKEDSLVVILNASHTGWFIQILLNASHRLWCLIYQNLKLHAI